MIGSYWLVVGSETELQIQVREILFDHAYLSKVIDDKKSWFTQMEVLDSFYHQYFFTANSLGWQPTTSQFVQPLSLQMLALVAASIHCALSEYATGKKVMVMFSQNEYWGEFCPSMVIRLYYCRSHCTTHQFHMVGCFIHPPSPEWYSSARIRGHQLSLALLSLDWGFDISFSAPQSHLRPRLGAPLFHSRLFASLPFWWCTAWMTAPLDRRSSMTFRAPPSTSALPSPTPHSTSGTPRFLLAHLFFLRNHPIAFQTPLWFTASWPLNSNLLDITNRANRHWNSLSPTRQPGMIRIYKKRLQLLCAVEELRVPALVGPDEMWEFVDDIETEFDWYHSDCLVGLLFQF